MKEYGSDFHFIAPTSGAEKTLYDFHPCANLYADGRQALIHLYHTQGWKRLWIPEYFCYEVVASLKQAGLDLRFYTDYPGFKDDNLALEAIQKNGYFKPTDALLRVNYFGTRSYRSSRKYSVAAVIEDHTHDLIGDWAMNSQADWCIASLRKTLPIPEGGILWSPVGLKLPKSPDKNEENDRIAALRWEAMRLKARYLAGEDVEKAVFRNGYVNTESFFDTSPVSALDERSKDYLHSFNVLEWYGKKRENWELFRDIKADGVRVLKYEDDGCYPFSLVLIFDTQNYRDKVRKALIEHQIYPAILWNIPPQTEGNVTRFSRNMLSIHCDARYTKEDIKTMKSIIESVL